MSDDRVKNLMDKYLKFRKKFSAELMSIGLDHRLDELEQEIFEDFEKRMKMETWGIVE